MWKIWLGIGMGGLVGAIIVLFGVINQTRFTVIFYRAALSMVFFGGGSCLMAFIYERYLLPYLLHKNVLMNDNKDAEVGRDDIGIVSRAEEPGDNDGDEQGFSPYTTENFNRVSPPNN